MALLVFLSHLIGEGLGHATENGGMDARIHLREAEVLWLRGLFAKITLQVDGLAELEDIYARAKTAGLKAYMIEDSGLTEFGGVKTKTAVGIGPDFASKIDPVCAHLKLY
jgi:PTH2 family peptidyl-tRNA hydrolase